MFLYIADGFPREDVSPIFAEEDIVSFGSLLLKGSRSQKYLKHGAGFKDIGNHPISPCVRWSIPKSIGVEGGVIGHGQNSTARGIHNDGHPIFRLSLFHGPLQFHLNDVLDGRVNG